MNTHDVVLKQLATIVKESSAMPFPETVTDEMLLEEFWLDSLALANLFIGIENELNCGPQPFTDANDFPRTVGALVQFYEQRQSTT